ncbi:hypothetical protein E2C01_035940 [Portunus trituberculatus]|uniref:Uncharacterized protein n=1 Tax=Portunus trituberculatus TaxID=210409 RepID=A0A5B7F5N6_PORTR|nr:hypothetical protein [Portunus trituberculatus]
MTVTEPRSASGGDQDDVVTGDYYDHHYYYYYYYYYYHHHYHHYDYCYSHHSRKRIAVSRQNTEKCSVPDYNAHSTRDPSLELER